ncbi:ABC transporter permease [Flavobacterium aciduliphilum]|uniref:ABC-2 type transport system permease protein n=1 Tax=Flavobacterium aciduliphilum TaxID=1101402 RepID=A0A328YN68_9FLAO|nr:ABC transporter permease [Flavobacterium aciduliphilum]RAR71526.1 ABC-2 type transport system permease protein [Flavobacterium aciduliphilum]
MLYKFWMTVKKELLLLQRDFGGLVILFVMPLVLIITITLIQNSAFKSLSENKIPILLVDYDNGSISKTVKDNLNKNGSFSIVSKIHGIKLNETSAKEAVFKGEYQLAIIIPEKLSVDLQTKVDQNVNKILSGFGVTDSANTIKNGDVIGQKEVRLYFDPATQMTFKNAVKSAIDKMISQIETQSIYKTFQDQLGESNNPIFDQKSFIAFKEIVPTVNNKEILPNSVQHNVPAWSLFAIFFIVVPLSINIVKEKGQGTQIRLITNPVPYAILIAGKTATYLLICLIQFLLMVAVGVYIFPFLDLPVLDVSGKIMLMMNVAFFSGLAAIGFGILLGTVAKTHEQSAPFGATSVVILAAIGGVWVPVFAMPKVMQYVSHISPMNWGLNAFYDVLLRNGSILEILPEIIFLLLFFITTITIAILYDKKKRAV